MLHTLKNQTKYFGLQKWICMDKDLIEYGGKTENFDPRIVILEGSPRPTHMALLTAGSNKYSHGQ